MKRTASSDTLDEQPSSQLNSTDRTTKVSTTNDFAHSAPNPATNKRPSGDSTDEHDPKRSKMASIVEDEAARDSAPMILLHHRSGPAMHGLKSDFIKAEGDPADYSTEFMRSGLYRGFTRVLIQGDVVSLWQFDRMGVMRSRRFFCDRGRRQILLYLAVAIVHSGFNKLSFQLMVDYANRNAFELPPFIDAYLWPEAQDKLREQDFFAQIRFLYDYPSSYEALLFDCNDTVLCVDHGLQVSSSWPFETEPAHSSTKATAPPSVDDASPAPTSNSSPPSINDTSPPSVPHSSLTTSFAITGRPIYAQPGVTGRGTVVYPLAPPKDADDYDPKELLVAKLSWQPSGRAAEARIIRCIRKAIPDRWRNHVTDVKCSKQVTAKAMALPRVKLMGNITESMKKKEEVSEAAQMKRWAKCRRELRFEQECEGVYDAFEERDFRVIVTTRYLPLQEVKNADEFVTVFKDVVKDPPKDTITAGMKGLLASLISPIMKGMRDTILRRLLERRSPRSPLVENDLFVFSTFMRVLEPDVPNPEEAVWVD
ncbi:uncharacterized protein STEHIDRAFT_112313 [Stereum hirsutum FP-91666 SS1]|uniref:uncharacterized protein n=1 Tax=Stereum hirsutum (strain FP-91666) TaxID=721885 RepID=UPI0004449D70|nr:uncharacterized protein STEHIDRAFT_112313 [Stereum hirsutum FP-91666 SS1]EIM84746.1 hypothetical protein STEHIDRAFT_112313 [Stereum hirsutum FP-91666 SS1]